MIRASLTNGLRLMLLVVIGLLGACATAPVNDPEALADFRATNDPLEPTNRFLYEVNETLDVAILRPVARAYGAVLPQPARNGIRNVLDNLGAPVRLVNDMLEGKPRRAGDTAMRLVINSTVGLWALHCVLQLNLFDLRTAIIRGALTVALFPAASLALGRSQRTLIGASA